MTAAKGVWALKIGREERAGVAVLSLTGRVGHASARGFMEALREAVSSGQEGIVVDLSAVDYVSSAGIRALADSSRQASRAGLGMTVCGLQEPVWLAMDLAGLVPELAVEPSRERALARLEELRAPRRRS